MGFVFFDKSCQPLDRLTSDEALYQVYDTRIALVSATSEARALINLKEGQKTSRFGRVFLVKVRTQTRWFQQKVILYCTKDLTSQEGNWGLFRHTPTWC